MKKFFSLFFVILLAAPVVLWLVGHVRGQGDDTIRQGFPLPEATLWLDRDYYQAVEGWFQESLPIGKPLKIFHNWLNYHLFSATANTAVHIGIHGWLYPNETTAEIATPVLARQTGHRLFLDLHAVEKMITATGRQFLVTVVPSKAAIYPEYVGSGAFATQSPVYQSLRNANARHPLIGLIGLEPALKKAKLNGIEVYHKRSHLWSCGAAATTAEQLLALRELAKPEFNDRSSAPCPPPDDDLYRLVLGQDPQIKTPWNGPAPGLYAVQGPLATAYGDDYLNRLLPFIAHAFKGIAVIDSTQVPTFGQNVMDSQSDLIVLQSRENALARLHLNLESLYAKASRQMRGLVKRNIALDGATPLTQCALDMVPDGLQIRSSGEGGFFALPSFPGSTNSAFRMVKLTFSPAHQGRITIRIRPDRTGLTQRTLSRENRHLIVPLPFNESVTMQINPSQHPGVFTLEKAELLSFYGKNPPPVPMVSKASASVGDIYRGMDIEPVDPPGMGPVVQPATQTRLHPTDALPELILTDIEQGRIFQRQGKAADVVVTGTYTGVAGPVEAQVVTAETGAVVVPWTVVDGSPGNGLFTGILGRVPQGGWYRLHVRSGIAPWVVKTGSNRWGVGLLIACAGQSNMREWFYTGEDHQPSTILMLHRHGRWILPGAMGNGSLALGNRLAAVLKIPVGLLDYSVNGTGLTAKAEWGKGFWLDTGPDGIYRRLIDGVNSTGGSVEYVLWMQGEADAARGTVSREEYRAALERFANNQLRSDIINGSSRPQLPFLIISLVKRPRGRDAACQWIRAAQMDTLKTIQECYLAALSMDLENRGRQHLAPASYTTLGIRTAQTILYLGGNVPYQRGPAIETVTRVSDRVIDIAIQHRGGTDFAPWSEITGFDVLSGSQLLSIASVSRKNGRTIRIELEDEAPREISVRYLYGAHPDTSRPVRDNTGLRLPLEPFPE